MSDNTRSNDPNTTEHEIVASNPDENAGSDRDRDAGQIRTSDTSQPTTAGRMPARRNA